MQILCQQNGKGPPEWRMSMKSRWSLDDWLPWWLFQPWNRNLPFKKPFACCQRQQSPPKAFCSERRREMKSFFLFLWLQQRGCKKLNTGKRPPEYRNCMLAFFLSGERILEGKDVFTWISTTQLLLDFIQPNFSFTEPKHIPPGSFEHSVPNL